jgi:enamine deaminase RidA (YjgF/YER057c/UK114 family)
VSELESDLRTRASSGSPYESEIGFSRAVREGNHIYVSGTAPIAADGTTVGLNDAAEQARRCFEIMILAIRKLGGSANDVVRTRIYLTRKDDWETVGKVHGEFFRLAKPASTMLVVKELLNSEWLVEIEAEAVVYED